MDLGAVVAPSGMTAWVYDPQRDVIHFTTSDGKLVDWSVSGKAFTTTLSIGGTPGSIDITADGAYALIGNRSLVTVDGAQVDQITRVDLASGTIDQLQFSPGFYETGVSDVAVGADGRALVTTTVAGSGWTAFRTFDATAANPTFGPVDGLVETSTSTNMGSYLLASDTHDHILVMGANISNGPVYVYDAGADRITFDVDLYGLGTSGFNTGVGDYNEARGLVFDLTYNNIFVFDDHLALVKDLSGRQSAGSVLSGVFDVDGRHLFLWRGVDHQVDVLDTSTWTQVGSFSVAGGERGYNGVVAPMDVIHAGQVLALGASDHVELVDLAQTLKLDVEGTAGADALYGAIGADTIASGDGNDTLVGGLGRDVLTGGAGDDLFVFAAGHSGVVAGALDMVTDWQAGDQLGFPGADGSDANYMETTAASYADALTFADQQIAGGAADYVAVQVGGDVVVFADSRDDDGGADDAVVLVQRTLADIDAAAIVHVDMDALGASSPPPVGGGGGSSGGETLSGGGGAESLSGGGGDDVISGAGGDDTLAGGAGADTLSGGDGADMFMFGVQDSGVDPARADVITDWQAGDQLNFGGLVGAPALYAEGSADTFADARAFADLKIAAGQIDYVAVQVGGDVLVFADTARDNAAAEDVVVLSGRTLSDISDLNIAGSDRPPLPPPVGGSVVGTAGDDILIGGGAADTLSGLGGDDQIQGAGGADSLSGGAGDDDIQGGPGDDHMDGGPGVDLLSYLNAAGPVTVSLAVAGGQAVGGGEGTDVVSGFENLQGGASNDSLTGDAGANHIWGWGGDDTIAGGGGDDTLEGREGSDSLVGGAGDDYIEGAAAGDVVSLGAGADTVWVGHGASGLNSATAARIVDWSSEDQLHFGYDAGAYAEATAASFTDALALANDAVAAGDRYLAVQVGADVVVFADTAADGGSVEDAVVLVGRTLADISAANLGSYNGPATNGPAPSSPPPAGVSLTGTSGADDLFGGSNADTLSGLGGADDIQGLGGADSLSGGAGDDNIQGGPGDDQMDGGAGVDVLSYINANAGVTVSLAITTAQNVGADQGTDVATGFENLQGSLFNDSLTGDAGANYIWGWAGDDTLSGGDGADTLDGREGADSIIGGAGDDYVEGAGAGDVISLGAGSDTVWVGSGVSGVDSATAVRITDWTSADHLHFGYNAGIYTETTAATYAAGLTAANALIAGGARYVGVQVGGDVVVFADTAANSGTAEDAVVLTGKTLADISTANLGSYNGPATDPTPPAPSGGGGGGSGDGGGAVTTVATGGGGGGGGGVVGDGFQTAFERGGAGSDQHVWTDTAASYDGGDGDDSLMGGDRSDLLYGGAGDDTIHGGGDNDSITGGSGSNYLRGDEGDDHIIGGDGFDDINGNQGDDTESGGLGDDWVVGGKDNDVLYGNEGNDIVYGNLGNDMLYGSVGDDLMRGGQGSDVVRGDEGDDWLSGDRGADTLTGGLGADIFHTFAEAGLDRVTDFNVAEGDRVQLDPGTVYTVSQVGGDTVIDMGGGNEMVLVGVQMSTLPQGWIFGA